MDRPSPHTRESKRLINRRRQGDLGEASAIEWLTRQGATVWTPLGHSPDADLIAEIDERLLRVQVKTSTYHVDGSDGLQRWEVSLATTGGNQSWNGIAKLFDPSRFELLFVLVGDGRRWLIPANVIEGVTGIVLGGPKYSEFEIESGAPIEALIYGQSPPLESSIPPRGSADVGESGQTVNLVATPEWVRIPPPPSTHLQSELPVGPSARTRVSANHQITIPLGPFQTAGIEIGQAIRVTAGGDGHLLLDRIDPPATNDAARE